MSANKKKSLSNAEVLDLAIKEYETNGEKKGTFYKMDDGRQYENYIDNDLWETFVGKMKKKTRDQYNDGSGGELKPWSYKGRQYPPKMASYGSSSRMIYLLSKKIDGFEFEKKLETKVGGKANLDGYLFRDGTHYYIEAKRREPYSAQSNHVISNSYQDLYDYLAGKKIGFDYEFTSRDDGDMNVTFFVDGKKINRFDLKQTICHLLAIANENLENPDKAKVKTTFLYLLYAPCEVMKFIPRNRREKICLIHREEKEECMRVIRMKQLYREILRYLHDKKGVGDVPKKEIDRISENFTFRLCDQFEYGEIVNPSSAQKQ